MITVAFDPFRMVIEAANALVAEVNTALAALAAAIRTAAPTTPGTTKVSAE